jgi:molybdate transport system substrate-binding protein
MSMLSVLFLAGWFLTSPAAPSGEPTAILVAAAASLQYSYANALIPDFQKKYPWITVEGTYDSSGKLQAQIENGLAADVFMSAAMKQMNELVGKGFIDAGSVVELLENRIVLIRPAAAGTDIAGFADAVKAKVIALGDPKSVPAGQYAREVFTSLGLWDRIEAKASFGTNVTEVLNWVAEGSADLGVVYATDAAVTGKVAVIAEAPAGSLKARVIYPVGISRNGERKEAAKLFVDYLRSEEALAVFARYGFSPNRGD